MGSFIILLPLLVVSGTAFSLAERQGVSAVAELSNQLAVDIHKKLSTGDDNVFFSPASVSTALGMLYYGTRGKTAEEMKQALGYQDAGLTDREVHAAFKNLMETFSEDAAAKEYLLYLANAVLTQKDFPILAEYKNGLLENYKAVARDVDFQKEGKKAVEEINDWVQLKTHNQIDKLLDDIDPSTIMVLLNAVYFKGTWKTQFDPKDTMEKVFYNKGLESEQKKVEMMYLVEELPYLRLGGARVIELPYKGDDISMVIVLPNDLDGLSKLEDQLMPNMIRDLRRNTRTRKIHLTLPKFKLEYEKSLKSILQKLGIKDVFENSADLSGISKTGPIAVSEVIHKASVEVNEEGSEASAVSGIVIEFKMLDPDRDFIVNHPFFFAIIDKRSDLILFQGRINQL